MKKILIAGVALLSLTACQDKIAFVDNAKLLDNYQEKKDIKAKLDKQVEAYQKNAIVYRKLSKLKLWLLINRLKNCLLTWLKKNITN